MEINELIDTLNTGRDYGYSKQSLDEQIFKYLSQDKNIIPALLGVLAAERNDGKQLLNDMNDALSMSLATLDKFATDTEIIASTTLKVKLFYKKWEHKILCCFNIQGLK